MHQLFGYLAGVLAIAGFIPYIRDILLKKTKPQRTTFFIWSVLAGIALSSQFAKGATDSLWVTIADTVLLIAIFILSIKRGVGGFARKDYIVL